MYLFLIANIVTTSNALVTRSDALVPSSLLFLRFCLFARHAASSILDSYLASQVPRFFPIHPSLAY